MYCKHCGLITHMAAAALNRWSFRSQCRHHVRPECRPRWTRRLDVCGGARPSTQVCTQGIDGPQAVDGPHQVVDGEGSVPFAAGIILVWVHITEPYGIDHQY